MFVRVPQVELPAIASLGNHPSACSERTRCSWRCLGRGRPHSRGCPGSPRAAGSGNRRVACSGSDNLWQVPAGDAERTWDPVGLGRVEFLRRIRREVGRVCTARCERVTSHGPPTRGALHFCSGQSATQRSRLGSRRCFASRYTAGVVGPSMALVAPHRHRACTYLREERRTVDRWHNPQPARLRNKAWSSRSSSCGARTYVHRLIVEARASIFGSCPCVCFTLRCARQSSRSRRG